MTGSSPTVKSKTLDGLTYIAADGLRRLNNGYPGRMLKGNDVDINLIWWRRRPRARRMGYRLPSVMSLIQYSCPLP